MKNLLDSVDNLESVLLQLSWDLENTNTRDDNQPPGKLGSNNATKLKENFTAQHKLDLLSELVPMEERTSSSAIDSFYLYEDLMDTSFVKIYAKYIPSKVTLIERDEITGKLFLKYTHEKQEWVKLNLV